MDAPSNPHHMPIKWHETVTSVDEPATHAPLSDKSALVCRVGLIALSGGTGSWRVREAMNRTARALGIGCSADISLTSINCTCTEADSGFTQVVSLPTTGVNTERITLIDDFIEKVDDLAETHTVHEIHDLLDSIVRKPVNYSAVQSGLASALACAAFVFLLGGGLIEMGCAFIGAGVGQWLRRVMLGRHINQLTSVGASVAAACLAYLCSLMALGLVVPDAMSHEAGYIGAMLFVIPGFLLITSGLDIAKLDMRSGLERLAYALVVILVATLAGWLVASMTQLYPDDFAPLGLSVPVVLGLRLVASFFGVFGFSIMFNSPAKTAATAGCIGAVANTLRLECVDLAGMPPEAAAFLGALAAGLLASAIGLRLRYPRITLTVPSIVIMVPGLYMYRAVYYMGIFETLDSMSWAMRAAMIVVFLPIGLALARVLTDKRWRYCS